MVLALAGSDPGELTPAELEVRCRSLMGALLRLARERDLGAQVGQGREAHQDPHSSSGVWTEADVGALGWMTP